MTKYRLFCSIVVIGVLLSHSITASFFIQNSIHLPHVTIKNGWENKAKHRMSRIHSTLLFSTNTDSQEKINQYRSSSEKNKDEEIVLLKSIGAPDHLKSLSVGQHLKAFRQATIGIDNGDSIQTVPSNFTIQKVSNTPNVFILRDFLSKFECESIISHVVSPSNNNNENGMFSDAETVTKGDTISRKKCKVAWISSSSPQCGIISMMISRLVSSIANIMLSKPVLTNPTAGVEDLQVLKYNVGGEFVLHHDGEPRILTVIYYVNGVGGTWFPFANMSSEENEPPMVSSSHQDKQRRMITPQNKKQALELCKGFQPGKQGLLIKGITTVSNNNESNEITDTGDDINPHITYIQQGDAIAFYNYKSDGSGELDWKALHAGIPADETKFIANHWFRVNKLSDY